MATDLTGPFIGYRSAGRRPESQQDRRAAADAPLSALRGMVSGVLGAPGDIESLIRMLPGLNEQTVLPTSEDIEKRLPMRELNQTPTGKAFTTAGQLGGGFYTGPGAPLRAVAALPSVGKAGARVVGKELNRALLDSSGPLARLVPEAVKPMYVVKPKGGNWLAGSVERSIEPMKRADPGQMTEEQLLRGVWENMRPLSESEQSMNRWLETKLGKYMRNEMATPEDPIRALAERGVLHVDPQQIGLNRYLASDLRRKSGNQAMGESEAAKAWEDASDVTIGEMPAGELLRQGYAEQMPWLAKVAPETPVYLPSQSDAASNLGFTHLADELRNAINPASGLPENLLWKYQDLEKVTVPQAVERVAKINEWRSAQKAEADMARAMGPATQVVKEYPEQGFKWVELRQPKETGKKVTVEKSEMELPDNMTPETMREVAMDMAYDEGLVEGTRAFEDFVRTTLTDFHRNKKVEVDESYKVLEDALKYEGETMGHCVGGYCPDVVEGRSKIYSLRDKKGQPHVTIEVSPGNPYMTWKSATAHLDKSQSDALFDQFQAAGGARRNNPEGHKEFLQSAGLWSEPPPDIVQIKGKGNKAPKEDYLPAVQDFVRSGNFGEVGDLGNTGLIDVSRAGPLMKALQDIYGRNMGIGMDKYNAAAEATPDAQRFMTKDELLNFLGETPPEGFARGGQVRGYQAGGIVKRAAKSLGEMVERYAAPAAADTVKAPGTHAGVLNQWISEQPEAAAMAINRNLLNGAKSRHFDYELREVPVEGVKPTQFGEDYLNDSSRYTAKELRTKDIYNIHRTNDALPIILDQSGAILDGNHRHAAAVLNGATTIPALVPVGKGSGKVTNLPGAPKNPGFAEGGQVSGANFPTDDFDPDRIDAIVGELHAMNAA
jgi:hypothetical protein